MKDTNSDEQLVYVNQNQLNGIRAGLAEIMQGCMTLNRVLTMIQIPESDKYPEGRPEDQTKEPNHYQESGAYNDSAI
jgi:hypothetical protein